MESCATCTCKETEPTITQKKMGRGDEFRSDSGFLGEPVVGAEEERLEVRFT